MNSFFADYSDFANIGLQKKDLVFYELTDSTNTRAREAFLEYGKNAPKVFVARRQSAGRGTRERSFESEEGGLYFSLLYEIPEGEFDQTGITPVAAAAALDAIVSMIGRRSSRGLIIKWVNDLYFGGKKIAGILSEKISSAEGSAYIIGIGINLSTKGFSPEVSGIASTVEEKTGIRIDPRLLLPRILARLLPALSSPKKSRLARIYKRKMIRCGTKISISDPLGIRDAEVIGIDSDFHLLVKYENGERAALVSGDVSIRIN